MRDVMQCIIGQSQTPIKHALQLQLIYSHASSTPVKNTEYLCCWYNSSVASENCDCKLGIIFTILTFRSEESIRLGPYLYLLDTCDLSAPAKFASRYSLYYYFYLFLTQFLEFLTDAPWNRGRYRAMEGVFSGYLRVSVSFWSRDRSKQAAHHPLVCSSALSSITLTSPLPPLQLDKYHRAPRHHDASFQNLKPRGSLYSC